MNVTIKVIPHNKHRYPTVGDWWYDKGGDLQIRVSKLSNWRYEMLVVIHELVEVVQCRHDGVTQKQVDKFDMAYEKRRQAGDQSEPGDSPKAPYRRQHGVASGVERILGALLGVSWDDYADELEALP